MQNLFKKPAPRWLKLPLDPQSAVDTWQALTDMFTDFSEEVDNAEVAALAKPVGTAAQALTDSIKTVFVDQDMAAMTDYTQATEDFSAAYQELLEVCGGAK